MFASEIRRLPPKQKQKSNACQATRVPDYNHECVVPKKTSLRLQNTREVECQPSKPCPAIHPPIKLPTVQPM